MGAFGSLVSPQAVFYVTAVLALPALLALSWIREKDVDPVRADGGIDPEQANAPSGLGRLLRKPELIIIVGCVLLFHVANAAMLPLVGSDLTMRSGQWATLLVAACIVAPQVVVAITSPTIGELAQSWGRRPLLLIGFGALPVRATLLALTHDPYMIVIVQTLDGVSAAAFGVLVPLVLADVSRGTGHFNLAQGIVGTATGIGAALSTTGAGYLADHFGISMAFLGLAVAAVGAFLLVLALLPETRPPPE
jgi:MFS family permease